MTGQETTDLLEKLLVRKSPSYNYEIVANLLTELEYLPFVMERSEFANDFDSLYVMESTITWTIT